MEPVVVIKVVKPDGSCWEARVEPNEMAEAGKLHQLESRLNEQAEKLRQIPTGSDLLAAMQQVLSNVMANLDQRLSDQSHTIEVLKTTINQTDELLERMMDAMGQARQSEEPRDYASEMAFEEGHRQR